MKITIDKAGRLVIPKRLREQYHFGNGSTIEILADNDGLRLRLPRTSGRLVDKDGVLVQQADSVTQFDGTTFINQQREARSQQALPLEKHA